MLLLEEFLGRYARRSPPESFDRQRLYEVHQSETPSSFLFFAETKGIDGKTLGGIQGKLALARKIIEKGAEDYVGQVTEEDLTEEALKDKKRSTRSDIRASLAKQVPDGDVGCTGAVLEQTGELEDDDIIDPGEMPKNSYE